MANPTEFVAETMASLPSRSVEWGEHTDIELVFYRRFETIDKLLEDGHYGNLLMVKDRLSGDICVSKSFTYTSLNSPGEEALRGLHEISIHKFLYHLALEQEGVSELFVRFIEAFYCAQINKTRVYLFMEFCPKGNLMSHDTDTGNYVTFNGGRTGFNRDEAKSIMMQIMRAIVFMHTLARIAHRDIKPENVFVSRVADGMAIVKLGDFGTSLPMGRNGSMSTANPGTPGFMPLEVLFPGTYRGDQGDIFSLGVMYAVMLTGERVIPANTKEDHGVFLNDINWRDLRRDCQDNLRLPEAIAGKVVRKVGIFGNVTIVDEGPNMDMEYKLISSMVHVEEASKRPSASEVLQTLWDSS